MEKPSEPLEKPETFWRLKALARRWIEFNFVNVIHSVLIILMIVRLFRYVFMLCVNMIITVEDYIKSSQEYRPKVFKTKVGHQGRTFIRLAN